MIVTEITAASWKQSLQPVPFSLIMWWATLDNINQLVCTHTLKCVWGCVCAKVLLQPLFPEKAFTFAHFWLRWICCVVILQMFPVTITELSFFSIVLLFITLLHHSYIFISRLAFKADVGVSQLWCRADQSYSGLFPNTTSRTQFPRIPTDGIWPSHLSRLQSHWQCLLHTICFHGIINKS